MPREIARTSSRPARGRRPAAAARGASLVEYLIALALFALLALGAVALFSGDIADTFGREGACVRSLGACGGGEASVGAGGAGLPGVGSDASGSATAEAPPADAPRSDATAAPPPDDGWAAAQSADGSKKILVATLEVEKGTVVAQVAGADLTFERAGGQASLKVLSGKADASIIGAGAAGAVLEGAASGQVGGVPMSGVVKVVTGEASLGVGCSNRRCGVRGGATAWVAKGDVSSGAMNSESAGDLKVGLSGAVLGAGAEAGLTGGDEDEDGHPEVEVTLKVGLGVGAGLTVRYESPAWLSRWVGWGRKT